MWPFAQHLLLTLISRTPGAQPQLCSLRAPGLREQVLGDFPELHGPCEQPQGAKPSRPPGSGRLGLRALIFTPRGPETNSSPHRQSKTSSHLSHAPLQYVILFWFSLDFLYVVQLCWATASLIVVFGRESQSFCNPCTCGLRWRVILLFNITLIEKPDHGSNYGSPVFRFHLLPIKCSINSQRW